MVDALAATRRRAWYVRSSVPLEGTVSVAGAKNSATKLMIAACLAGGASELQNVPDIADTKITAAMLQAVGAGVALESGRAVIDGSTLCDAQVGVAYSGLNRGVHPDRVSDSPQVVCGGAAQHPQPIGAHPDHSRPTVDTWKIAGQHPQT